LLLCRQLSKGRQTEEKDDDYLVIRKELGKKREVLQGTLWKQNEQKLQMDQVWKGVRYRQKSRVTPSPLAWVKV
jgi:hypothetical protein